MNLAELKTNLKSKETLPNLLIFYGEEYKLIDIYLGFVKKLFNTTKNFESFSTIQKQLESKSLFSDTDTLYLVRNDSEFLASGVDIKKMQTLLKKKNLFVILTFYNVDARTKVYKENEDIFVEFQHMSPQVLKKNILKQFHITDKQADYIIEICNCSYGHILLELDKVRDYAEYTGITEDAAFLKCYEEEMFYEELCGDFFELVKAILSRNAGDSYYFLEESKRRGDSAFAILSVLHNNVKGILQIQLLPKDSNIQEVTGLNGFQQKNIFPYIGKYNPNELVKFIKLIKYCESAVKNGTMEESMVVDYILVNVL